MFEPGVYHFRLNSTEHELQAEKLTLLCDPPELNPLCAIDDLALYFDKNHSHEFLKMKNLTTAEHMTKGKVKRTSEEGCDPLLGAHIAPNWLFSKLAGALKSL